MLAICAWFSLAALAPLSWPLAHFQLGRCSQLAQLMFVRKKFSSLEASFQLAALSHSIFAASSI